MKYVKGCLIELALNGEFDVIVHGCNCFNTMGKGIAKTIKQNFPEAYKADLQTRKGSKKKLGDYTSAISEGIVIVNAYTQYDYKGRGVLVNMKAIRNVFTKINNDFKGKNIGIPKIGAGLAKGDWDSIIEVIKEVTPDIYITVVEYNK